METGVMLNRTNIAEYRGLKFIITPSSKHPSIYYCSVRGSLHKYHNKGLHNANDFTYLDLLEVLQELKEKFHIDPFFAIIRNLEFGVNLLTPLASKRISKNVLACTNKAFTYITIKGVKVGKHLEKGQYTIKQYDKGSQHPEIAPVDNLMRFEIAVKKMAFLNKCGITHLSDLMDLQKLEGLKELLIKYWDSIIYFDKKHIQYKQMKPKEQNRILYYANPQTWEDFNYKTRDKAKVRFRQLIAKYGTTDTHKEISQSIAQKWDELAANKNTLLNHVPTPKPANKKGCFDHDKSPAPAKQTGGCESENGICLTSDKPKEKPARKRECVVCSANIENKRVGAIYCGKRCNNKSNYQKRKKKRIRERQRMASKRIKPKERQRDKVLMMPVPTLFNQNYDDG